MTRIATRPYLPPGYGVVDAEMGSGLLAWEWAEQRLERARSYWVSSVAPDGRPHAMPVWGIWWDAALWFSTDGATRKARNLAHDPRCVVTPEDASEAVIVEALAEFVDDGATRAELAVRYEAKYGMGFPPDSSVLRARADVVFAFTEMELGSNATRWRFVR